MTETNEKITDKEQIFFPLIALKMQKAELFSCLLFHKNFYLTSSALYFIFKVVNEQRWKKCSIPWSKKVNILNSILQNIFDTPQKIKFDLKIYSRFIWTQQAE